MTILEGSVAYGWDLTVALITKSGKWLTSMPGYASNMLPVITRNMASG